MTKRAVTTALLMTTGERSHKKKISLRTKYQRTSNRSQVQPKKRQRTITETFATTTRRRNSTTTSKMEKGERNRLSSISGTVSDAEALGQKLGSVKPTYLTGNGSSWYILVKGWMKTPSDEAFRQEWELHPAQRNELVVFGRPCMEKRWSQAWGVSFAYSGSMNKARPIEESTVLQQLMERVNECTHGIFWERSGCHNDEQADKEGDEQEESATKDQPSPTATLAEQEEMEKVEEYVATTTENQPTVSTRASSSNTAKGDTTAVLPQVLPYNGCLQNWYEPIDTIGRHSDDEKSMKQGLPIFSLSWGGPRRFVFYRRQRENQQQTNTNTSSKGDKQKVELLLEDGDLLVMGGTCQDTHKHEVPKVRVTLDPLTSRRINWTVRSFVMDYR